MTPKEREKQRLSWCIVLYKTAAERAVSPQVRDACTREREVCLEQLKLLEEEDLEIPL